MPAPWHADPDELAAIDAYLTKVKFWKRKTINSIINIHYNALIIIICAFILMIIILM